MNDLPTGRQVESIIYKKTMANEVTILEQHIRVGDTVAVSFAYLDKGKEKSQIYEGIVLSVHGTGAGKTITVRKMTKSKIGVERVLPISSPFIKKIKVLKKTKNTKAKVNYIRRSSDRDIREQLYTK